MCLRFTLNTASDLNDERACTIPVRCMAGGTSSAVHTSTAARVPPIQLDIAGSATKRRVLLAHTLSHTLLRRTYASSSPGLWAKCLRWYTHYLCISMHTTAHVYETQTAIPSPKKKKSISHCARWRVIFYFLLFLFFACLRPFKLTGATRSPPARPEK